MGVVGNGLTAGDLGGGYLSGGDLCGGDLADWGLGGGFGHGLVEGEELFIFLAWLNVDGFLLFIMDLILGIS